MLPPIFYPFVGTIGQMKFEPGQQCCPWHHHALWNVSYKSERCTFLDFIDRSEQPQIRKVLSTKLSWSKCMYCIRNESCAFSDLTHCRNTLLVLKSSFLSVLFCFCGWNYSGSKSSWEANLSFERCKIDTREGNHCHWSSLVVWK